MRRIYSNGRDADFVVNPFVEYLDAASHIQLAAPYFTEFELIASGARRGKSIQLLVGLNSATSPRALQECINIPNLGIRYFTDRFHAKLYLFEDIVLIGSANLTDGGLKSNREAVVVLHEDRDSGAIDEARSLFLELWDSASVLTPDILRDFAKAHAAATSQDRNPDSIIEKAIGRREPVNIGVESWKRSPERIFIEDLRRRVYEQYRPSFSEVTNVLEKAGFRRDELRDIGIANETNRFLNWLRLTYVIGDEAWRCAPMRSQESRQEAIAKYGAEWTSTSDHKVPDFYVPWLLTVRQTFGSLQAVRSATKGQITKGLLSLHAFTEQLRFTKGGIENLPIVFWRDNSNDLERVKRSLAHLLYGSGDFVERLHDVIYRADLKLRHFGLFCALELYGSIVPEVSPPINGRMAKALRFLGFDVKGS